MSRIYPQQRIVVSFVIVFVLLAVLLVALDWSEVHQIVGRADWELTIVAFVFTGISYSCLCFGYVLINRAFAVQIGWRELFEVGLVSTALNNILAFLGAAGHSLRLALIKRPGVAAGGILAASIFHSYLNNVIMLLLLAIGLISLLVSHTVYGGSAVALGLTTAMLLSSLGVATAIVLISPLRLRVMHVFNAVSRFVTHHDITPFLADFHNALTQGMVALNRRRLLLTLLLGLMVGDWVFAAFVLRFCFEALGHAPSLGVLLAGFGIGISVGNLSMLPGGLGAQEASMAGVFALLGTSLAQGVLASILFRVVYDFVPFLVTLALYKGLLRKHG